MIAFIHIEKTAGQTIKWILRSSFGIRHCDVEPWRRRKSPYPFSPEDLRRLRKIYPSLRSIAGHTVVPFTGLEEACPEIQYFTFLRDPIKQCASYYQYLVDRHGKSEPFDKWIHSEWPRNMQTKRIAGVADAEYAYRLILKKKIFVGLLEAFDESLQMLKTNIIPNLNIAYIRRNTAPQQVIAERLLRSSSSLEQLLEATQVDRALYERVNQELYPSYQRQYITKTGEQLMEVDIKQNYNQVNIFLNRAYRNLVYKLILRIQQTKF